VTLDLGGYAIKLLSLEALIDAKQAMGRPRDLLAAEELRLILKRRQFRR
jgi:hypothetical protein